MPPMRARDIPDSGLRLGILEALLALGHLDKDDLRERLEAAPAKPDRAHGDEQIAEALARLAKVEIDGDALAEFEHSTSTAATTSTC